MCPLASHEAGTVVEPDNGRPLFQTPPLLSIDTVTLSAPTTVHETVTSGFTPLWNVTSGAAHALGFDTEKLEMISGAVAGVVLAVTGLAVVAGAVVVGLVVVDAAAVVVVAAPATVVVVDDVVVVEPESVEVFDVELQLAMTALIKTAERNLRRDIMAAL